MMDYKSEILRLLPIDTMLRHFGLTPKRGFICCPFHADDTASLRIYPDTNTFYCFGCGKGGNVVDFATLWYNAGFYPTLERLNREFRLNLPIDRKPTLREQFEITQRAKKAAEERERKNRERERLFEDYWAALDTYIAYERFIERTKPKSPDDEPNPFYGVALQKFESVLDDLNEAEGRVIAFG